MENPAVAILLATYNPNQGWLEELLDSLNEQTYAPLFLYVRDDASATISLEELDALLHRHITRFPYKLLQNECNLGSNATFGKLVTDAHEPYVMFCDQDDVWLPEKVENTWRLFCKSPLSPIMVCTNVSVIDGEGNETSPRIDKQRRRHVFLRGEGLAPILIYRNFAMGCTMLIERERLASYLPFPSAVVHDHYIAFRAAAEGAIDYLDEPQLHYRVYGSNQTAVMAGVHTKEDYFMRRIKVFSDRIQAFAACADFSELQAAKEWSEARIANFKREKGGFRSLWKKRHVDLKTSVLELFVLRFPTPIFRFVIKLLQKGYL